MRNIKTIVGATALLLSTFANAAIITHGNLTTDNTTNYIVDTNSGRQYLRLDVLADLNYQQTVDAVTTGAYQEWSIASTSEADDFIYSYIEETNACSSNGTANFYTLCADAALYNDGDFGDNYSSNYDYFWFLNDEIDSRYDVGFVDFTQYNGTSTISQLENWAPLAVSDAFSLTGSH